MLPELTDLSSDHGVGVRGVTLPDAGIDVARDPDGAVILHFQDQEIRLGDPQHVPARGRTLAAAILAASAARP
ncbi:hypothetical protein ACBI99_44105 [Nonomuraea sp. ATR24]|uniref:hypothetical protein n=1 Tax=Nonomuraea sp. ATR24 TaxID=1676744 RepID=UPI0035C12BAD